MVLTVPLDIVCATNVDMIYLYEANAIKLIYLASK